MWRVLFFHQKCSRLSNSSIYKFNHTKATYTYKAPAYLNLKGFANAGSKKYCFHLLEFILCNFSVF